MKEYNKWILVSLTGGLLMIICGTAGNLILYYLLYNLSQQYLNNKEMILILFILLLLAGLIADSGGIAVIVGSMLIFARHYRIGKIISSFGTGLGLIGLIFIVVYYYFLGFILFGSLIVIITISSINEIIGGTGLLLAIFSRKKICNPKEYDLNDAKVD